MTLPVNGDVMPEQQFSIDFPINIKKNALRYTIKVLPAEDEGIDENKADACMDVSTFES